MRPGSAAPRYTLLATPIPALSLATLAGTQLQPRCMPLSPTSPLVTGHPCPTHHRALQIMPPCPGSEKPPGAPGVSEVQDSLLCGVVTVVIRLTLW